MIIIDRVGKTVRDGLTSQIILADIAVLLPGNGKIALLGAAGAGKTTLLRMICGIQRPTAGRIECNCRVSFPLGFMASATSLTVRQYVGYVGLLFGCAGSAFTNHVIGFAELEKYDDKTLLKLSSEQRAGLNFAIGYSIDFDFYLLDGKVTGGSESVRAKCMAVFESRVLSRGFVFATRQPRLALRYCDSAIVLANKTLYAFSNVEDGVAFYSTVATSEDDESASPSNEGDAVTQEAW